MADNKTQFTNEQLDSILSALEQRVKEKTEQQNVPTTGAASVPAPRAWTKEEIEAMWASHNAASCNCNQKTWEDRTWDAVTIAGGVAGGIGIVSLVAYLFKK